MSADGVPRPDRDTGQGTTAPGAARKGTAQPGTAAPTAAPTAVALRGVEVRYGADPALSATLDIAPGERVALVGPSGAGKSTLLGLCSGARPLAVGTVEVLGVDLAAASRRGLRAVRSRIGSVHQRLDLVGPLTALQNVSAGRLGRWGTARSLASLVRPVDPGPALEAMRRLGIEDLAGARTDRLSGGEQQRVALARVLVQDPALVLADEPIASLDPGRARVVMDLLTEVVASDSRTLLVSLHDFAAAQETCDRVVGLRRGEVVFDLPAGEVTAAHRDALYRLGA
ncbi:phosphonate ABC transporter ATP-binding protein [Brachybacterium sp. HMSC06H03]|uniref:phosphonate ABC transporter ATP-binding protein n=1 Tax=Brachybacterium sp. HMSC06H03 TaxID=1581127 RepID=UPI0009F3531B|nr:ATP-binding cassette domain-containing protein [Brachybacterium sp. HMSC06H03]